MALLPEDVAEVNNLIDAKLAAANAPLPRPPANLVYEGNGSYYNPDNGDRWVKTGGNLIKVTGG